MSTDLPQTEPPVRRARPSFAPPESAAPGTAPVAVSEAAAPAAPPRPDPITTREEDPRTRAARRALELQAHGAGDTDEVDKFFIDPKIIPEGWSYEWKTFTVLGAENPGYQVNLARQGWEAVPARRHPEMMPMNHKGNTIEREGQILMERPAVITDAAKARDLRRAREQVNQKEAQLAGAPVGTFDRDNKGTPMANIKRSYEPMQIPK